MEENQPLSLERERLQPRLSVPKEKINWPICLWYFTFNAGFFLTTILQITGHIKVRPQTVIFAIIYGFLGGFGITIGAHRLFAHRTFKAKPVLKMFLILCQTTMCQYSVYTWVKWHRTHHKYTDTDMDPHNASRGFFYSHMGWILQRTPKREAYITASVHLADLEADKLVMWQHRNIIILTAALAFIIPTIVPWYFFDEYPLAAIASMNTRLFVTAHITHLVNSAAHLYGIRPYSTKFLARENRLVGVLSLGEGWHNYHHAFPSDYRASEWGLGRFNLSTALIDLFARFGWAYDLKTASAPLIHEYKVKYGDGSLKNPTSK